MTRIAHVGPPLARQGGPAGYLYQLAQAARVCGADRALLLPEPAVPTTSSPRATIATRARRSVSRVKRHLLGPPRQARPSEASLRTPGGEIDASVRTAVLQTAIAADASLQHAFDQSADLVICHDTPTAERALERRGSQQVWLMLHSPMPLALYLAWNWGVPERDWRDVVTFPDVERWIRWELDVWARVDRLLIPCREALDEISRIAPAVASLRTPVSFILSGARATESADTRPRNLLRRHFGLPADRPLGLFLGNSQAYRGLDALVAGAGLLGNDHRGAVVVAGPPRDAVARGRRILPLGPVSAVADLLTAVDFVINVNRFSLFDLSTIEAVEAGKPLLLHAVGGNRTFAALGAGVELIDGIDAPTIAAGLDRMFAMTSDRRRDLETASRRCYDEHLTLALFWQRHAQLYAEAAGAVA